MRKKIVSIGILCVVNFLWAVEFNPDGSIKTGDRRLEVVSSAIGEEINCLPKFDPKNPYYLGLVESLRRARELGDKELIRSVTNKIMRFTGMKWREVKQKEREHKIIVIPPDSREVLTREELQYLKGHKWRNIEVYDANSDSACYGDVGSAANSGGSDSTLYAVFDRWDDEDTVWKIHIYKSINGGESWTEEGGFFSPTSSLRYPTLAVTRDGELLIAYFVDRSGGSNDAVEVCKYPSYDIQVVRDFNVYCPHYTYRPRIVVDYPYDSTSYSIYVTYQTYSSGIYTLQLARSTDQNTSYTQTSLKQSIVEYLGYDLMFIDNESGRGDYLLHARPVRKEVRFLISLDYGISWTDTALTRISTDTTVYYPTIGGVDRTDHVFCAWGVPTPTGFWEIHGRYSTDRAESWSSEDIPIFLDVPGLTFVPVIQERTFDEIYYITAFHRPTGTSCQVLVSSASVNSPDVWEWEMIRDTSIFQKWSCAPRIVTWKSKEKYTPAVVWTDMRDGNYDWYFGKRINKDVKVKRIHWPTWSKVPPETTGIPYCEIENVGTVDVSSIPVVFEIINIHDTTDFYICTTFVSSLPARDSVNVDFAKWTSGLHPTSYVGWAYTLVDGDINPENDSLSTIFTACDRQLESGWGTPMLDGILDTVDEWGNAEKIDISSTTDIKNPPGSCILYVLNDSANLYLGIEYKIDNSLEEADGCSFYFDEDHNEEWNPDSSEGSYVFVYPSLLTYTSKPADWEITNPSGFEVVPALIGGRVTYESKIPFGEEKTDLTAGLGEVIGFLCAIYDKSEIDIGGAYPQDCFEIIPYGYADLKLAKISGVEESWKEDIRFGLWVLNSNPIKNKVRITFSLPKAMKIKLSVYDISGRLITKLADRMFKRGIHIVDWTPKVRNGVYFIRLHGEENITKKVILLR